MAEVVDLCDSSSSGGEDAPVPAKRARTAAAGAATMVVPQRDTGTGWLMSRPAAAELREADLHAAARRKAVLLELRRGGDGALFSDSSFPPDASSIGGRRLKEGGGGGDGGGDGGGKGGGGEGGEGGGR